MCLTYFFHSTKYYLITLQILAIRCLSNTQPSQKRRQAKIAAHDIIIIIIQKIRYFLLNVC